MPDDPAFPQPRVTFTRQKDERSTRVDALLNGRSVSHLWVVPFCIRVGAATVRMDGIGGVGTEEEYRKRGYARRVLEAAVRWMQQGDAAISMLYGIRDFYPKFGYATAGPDHFLYLRELSSDVSLPAGWRVRPFTLEDMPAIRGLYERNTARAVGAAVREESGPTWSALASAAENPEQDVCRVIEDPAGRIAAYAWRAKHHWYTNLLEREDPDSMVIGEVMADSPPAADAVLVACRQWAMEESAQRSAPIKHVLLPLAPEGPVAAAARQQNAALTQLYSRCGGSMARVLNVQRLLRSLTPELNERLRSVAFTFSGTLHLKTDLEDVALRITPEGVCVEETLTPARQETVLTAHLPQTVLARLALGAFPPDDLLARLDNPPEPDAQRLLEILFPPRHPHMFLPDRF